MRATEVLSDNIRRIEELVAGTVEGLTGEQLRWRADPQANTIAWLVWHLTRVQDDHVAAVAGHSQVWLEEGWVDRFELPWDDSEIGYGQKPDAVEAVRANADLLTDYHRAVAAKTAAYLDSLSDADLERVVDEAWDPPVTLGVRLVSVIGDDLQHVGQAAYLRGLVERAGI